MFTESLRLVEEGSKAVDEWTYEVGKKGRIQVMPDGMFARYQGTVYDCT